MSLSAIFQFILCIGVCSVSYKSLSAICDKTKEKFTAKVWICGHFLFSFYWPTKHRFIKLTHLLVEVGRFANPYKVLKPYIQ